MECSVTVILRIRKGYYVEYHDYRFSRREKHLKRTLSKSEKNYVFESALLHILYENSIIIAKSRFRKMKNILVLKAGNYL